MHYSDKKGSSTSVSGGSLHTKHWQFIFASKILRALYGNKLIINIDECSF